jgi:translation initiation factor IF-2
MRVYEYAKHHSISNKDLIQFLREKGFDVSSHMAVIPADALPVLAAQYEKKEEKKPLVVPAVEKIEKKVEEKIEKKAAAPPPIAPSVKKIVETKSPVSRPTQPAKSSEIEAAPSVEADGIVIESMAVGDFALRSKRPVSEVILTLLRQGVVAVKNQIISEQVVGQLARHFGIKVREAETKTRPANVRADVTGHTEERLPVVVVIGHVDHGKTTLLDFIRKTRVAARERGGITQHLGAYEAHTHHGNLVFLDTPGHGAFSKMRERGTRVADIAILVVAADDGIMPQSIEAIKQAQAAKIPLVVAVNKIDKAAPQQVEAVKRGLAQYGLVPEEWGGQAVCMPVSAKVGTGVDALLEVIVLQSKLMELSAVLDVPARGYILEAKKEKGRGPVATVLCQHGILRVGDSFVSGATSGKVTSLIDSWGKRVNEVHPSQPVQVAGFDDLPQAGEPFEVIDAAALKKVRQVGAQRVSVVPKAMQSEGLGLNVLLKVDNDSSREAVLDALDKINKKAYTKLHVIAATIGNVSEGDVQLAHDTSALIYMLHTKAEASALALATKYGVTIHHYDIIYKLLEALESSAAVGKPVKMISKKIGEAVVLKVFDIKNLGVIAGAQVRTGRLIRDGKVSIWRGKNKIAEGTIKSLQREKKSIKEATAGYECAFMVEGFDAWLPDDRVECYQEVPE